MGNKVNLYRKILYIYILSAPFVDMFTSIGVRLGLSGMTVGMLVRVAFIAAMGIYVLFVYRGAQKGILRGVVIITALYGMIFLLSTCAVNGMGVLVENAKMYLKAYSFVYVLLGFYALYKEHGILVSDKLLTVAFCIYTASIFLSAVTDTSFYTYQYKQVGYCGWFYAGNEIGAIIAVLSGVTLLYGFTHPKYLWAVILGLLAFSCTYIGTKVPFLAIVAITVLLLVFWLIKYFAKKGKRAMPPVAKCGVLLLCILILYQTGSPIQQNTSVAGENYQNIVESIEPDEPEAPSGSEETKDDQAFVFVNWLLSNRLVSIRDVVNRYGQGNWAEKLFGIGYTFRINGEWRSDVVEMDFISIFLKHGIIGFGVFMAPLMYFAVICLIKLLKQLKHFLELEPAFVYLYATLIGLGCAFLAGHVLVAPAVSVYVAICIVKCYAYLSDRAIAQGDQDLWRRKSA